MKKILELQVADRPGVLDRLVSLIRRRGWNIDSLTAGDIGGGLTQITIQLEGRDLDLEALGDSLYEMDAVRHWQALSEAGNVLREMLLFCLPTAETPPTMDGEIRVIRETESLRYCEYTDLPSRVDVCAALLLARGVACVRSGPLSMLDGLEGGTADA